MLGGNIHGGFDFLNRCIKKAADEMSHYPEYDYIIVNHDLDQSVARVKAILEAERLKRDRQIGLTDFVKNLRDGH